MKDKPVSMSVKDYLVTRVAEEMGEEEDLCNTIISWSYRRAKDALETDNIVEISGFGKFITSNHKVMRRITRIDRAIDQYLKQIPATDSEERKQLLRMRINTARENKIKLLDKIRDDRLKESIRGMAERFVSTGETERINQGDSKTEAGDMSQLSV